MWCKIVRKTNSLPKSITLKTNCNPPRIYFHSRSNNEHVFIFCIGYFYKTHEYLVLTASWVPSLENITQIPWTITSTGALLYQDYLKPASLVTAEYLITIPKVTLDIVTSTAYDVMDRLTSFATAVMELVYNTVSYMVDMLYSMGQTIISTGNRTLDTAREYCQIGYLWDSISTIVLDVTWWCCEHITRVLQSAVRCVCYLGNYIISLFYNENSEGTRKFDEGFLSWIFDLMYMLVHMISCVIHYCTRQPIISLCEMMWSCDAATINYIISFHIETSAVELRNAFVVFSTWLGDKLEILASITSWIASTYSDVLTIEWAMIYHAKDGLFAAGNWTVDLAENTTSTIRETQVGKFIMEYGIEVLHSFFFDSVNFLVTQWKNAISYEGISLPLKVLLVILAFCTGLILGIYILKVIQSLMKR